MATGDIKKEVVLKGHDLYQRLQEQFPLDFVIKCLIHPTGDSSARHVGELLTEHMENDPSFFITGLHYHVMHELSMLKDQGHDDSHLAEHYSFTMTHNTVHVDAKREELKFYQYLGNELLQREIPFPAFIFSYLAAASEWGYPIPHYASLCTALHMRINDGLKEYGEPFTIDDVRYGIGLFRHGGDKCPNDDLAIEYASLFIEANEADHTKAHRYI